MKRRWVPPVEAAPRREVTEKIRALLRSFTNYHKGMGCDEIDDHQYWDERFLDDLIEIIDGKRKSCGM